MHRDTIRVNIDTINAVKVLSDEKEVDNIVGNDTKASKKNKSDLELNRIPHDHRVDNRNFTKAKPSLPIPKTNQIFILTYCCNY